MRLSSNNNLTVTAFKNAFTALFNFFSKIIIGMIITPVLVNGLGDLHYGVLQLLSKFFGYLSAADARPTQALKWVIANNQSRERDLEKKKAIACSIKVWLWMLPVMLVLGGLLIYFVPDIVSSPLSSYSVIRLASAILFLNILLSGIAVIPGAVLRGMNLAHKSLGVVTAASVLGSLLMVLAVKTGFGLIGVAVAYLIQTAVTGVFFLVILRKYCPWAGLAKVTRGETKSFLKISIWYSIWAIIDKLNTSSIIVLVGILISVEAVTSLSLSSYAANTSLVLFSVIVGAILPGIGNHFANANFQVIRNVRKELLLLSFLLATVLGSLVVSFNEAFTSIWVGSERYIGNTINLVILLNILLMLYIRNESMLIDLTLNVKQKSLIGLASIALTIVLALVLYRFFDVLGVCIAAFLGRIPMAIGYSINLNKVLHGNEFHVSDSIRPLILLVTILLSALYISPVVTKYAVDWLHLILFSTGVAVLSFTLAFYLGCSRAFRKQLITRITGLVH